MINLCTNYLQREKLVKKLSESAVADILVGLHSGSDWCGANTVSEDETSKPSDKKDKIFLVKWDAEEHFSSLDDSNRHGNLTEVREDRSKWSYEELEEWRFII